MIYEFQCIICGEHFECVQSMNIEHKAFHCGIEAQRIWGNCNTDKDLAYNFTTKIFGNPREIYSKKQYRNLLKSNGLVDASLKECRQEAEFRKRINTEDYTRERKEAAKDIFLKNKKLLTFRRSNGRR